MKTSKITLSIAAIMVAMAFSITSCKKHETEAPEDKDTGGASDNSLAEKSADDITNIGGQAAEDNSLNAYRFGEDAFGTSCATVLRDTVMKTITVTFSGQQCLDGHTRSGSLLFDYSASTNGAKYYRDPGFALTVTSTNYIVDGNQINIVNKSVQNTTPPGFNPASVNLTWSVNTNINVVKVSGGTISWTANKVKTLLNTSDTNVYRGPSQHIVWTKAIIGITGNASGTTANGDNFSAATTSQLVRDMNCSPNSNFQGHHPFIQGTLDFTPGTKAVRHFDYGNGACDDQATVTINGNTYTITLK